MSAKGLILLKHLPDLGIAGLNAALAVQNHSMAWAFLTGLYAGLVLKTVLILFRGVDLVEEAKLNANFAQFKRDLNGRESVGPEGPLDASD